MQCTLLVALMGISGGAFAQRTSKKSAKIAQVREWVSSDRYVFKARSAQSMSGYTRQLTSEYTLAVTPDTIVAYLPYFGRAYSAPIDPSKGGIKFTSTRFDYQVDSLKRGGWSVKIRPSDTRDIQQMNLRISSEGYATLNVTAQQRQPITFSGVIVEKE